MTSNEQKVAIKMTNEQKVAIKEYYEACEKFLVAFGWRKLGEKHWSPKQKTSHVYPFDLVFLGHAMKAQLDALAWHWLY